MAAVIDIVTLTPAAYAQALDEHGRLLHHCVEAGAPVGFVWPFTFAEARKYFEDLVPAVNAGKRIMMVAKDAGRIVGSMQLDLDVPPSQFHRAAGRKLLVHADVRHRGVGTALMIAMEDEARKAGRTLVDFVALAGGAPERLYVSIGYKIAGIIPDCDHLPDGTLCSAAVLYKHLT
jgi:GNAT superfamily N-acetyltransferase